MIRFADVGWKVEVVLVIVTVLCTAQIPAFDGVIQPTICQKLTTSYCSGKGDDCVDRYQQIECYHGVCSNETGECLCSPCWTGEKCHTLENSHIPSFEQKQLTVDINRNSLYKHENNFIAKLNAKDHDIHKCPSGQDCPCATVLYSIERGNEDSMFMIDPRKGELSLSLRGGEKPPHGKIFNLMISARNPVHRSRDRRMAVQTDEQLETMSNIAVTVNFVNARSARSVPEEQVAHSRQRRSAGFASDVTFVLEKLDPWTSKTEILIAERVPFRLTIWLPQQTLTPTVELLTQYESSAVMTVCDPQFSHVGVNYGKFNPDAVKITKHAHGNDNRFDRIVLDLGTIDNDGTDSSDQDASKIKIDFFAVLEDNNATQFGEDYHVSAGVMYDDGNEIWVGQETFSPKDDEETWLPFTAPLISMKAPSTLSKQTVALVSIDIVLENIATPGFYVDVLTQNYSMDPIMYLGDFEFAGTGGSFCLAPELPKVTERKDNETGTISFVRLDFGGPIVNPGFRGGERDDAKNTVTLTASLYMTNNSDVVTGDTYWFSTAMYVAKDEGILYTQQIGITAADVVPADMSKSLDFEFYAVDGYTVIAGGGIGFVLNIYTKPGTSHLIVDLSLPYEGGAAVMHLWKGSVIYNGRNIPCVGELVEAYYKEDNKYVDYIQFDFGRITNLDRKNPHHVDPDLLQVHFSAEMVKTHPLVDNGTEFLVQAGVRYELDDKDVLWAVEIPVVSMLDQDDMYKEPTKQAQFWLRNRASDNMLYNDTTVSFDLIIYIPPETTYTPLFVNISAERNKDGKPLFNFCRMNLEHLGSNFHLNPEESIDIKTFTTPEGIVSDFNIDFGIVSNTMPAERAGFQNNSYFVFELRASWLNHDPWLENGTMVSTMVNITYGPEGSWNGTMEYEISYDMNVNLQKDDKEPEFNLYLDPTRTNQLKAGQTGVYYLETIVPPDSVAGYFVDVTTPNHTLSVCAVRLVEAGKNMPCFVTDRVVNYWSKEEDYHRDRGYLEIGAVRNIGYESETKNPVKDNLMLTQVVVKLEDKALPPNNETKPDNQTFLLTSRVGTTDMYTRAETIIVDEEPVSTNLTTIPKIKFEKHTSEDKVTLGSGVVFDLDLYIPYDSTADYKVTFQSDVEDKYRTTICSARVISSGWNIPCINGSFLIPVFNSTVKNGHIDVGFLNAKDITNIEKQSAKSVPLMDETNKVRVQLIARLERNETHIDEGDTISLGASVIMNNANEYLLEATFNATEQPIYKETYHTPQFQLYCAPCASQNISNVSMTIGSTEVYFIKITTPPMATPMVLNITMPTSGDEAILTIKKMDYVRVGENYACYDRLELEPVYDSMFNTSQNTSAIVDLGILMNHGTSHIYQYYPGKHEDNEMIISLEVQLADNYDLVNGSTVSFDVEFQYSLNRTHVLTEDIIVVKTGQELPVLDFNITFFNYNPWELHQEDKLRAMITVYHTNESEAHAHAMFVYFMVPYYIEIDEDIEIEGPAFCVKASDEGIKFHFEEVFFTDTFTMWFNFSLDPQRYMPMEWVFVNTTVPLEVVYYDLAEMDSNGSVVLGNAYKTKTELLDLTFTIEDCSDTLGLESGSIVDCQVKSSSMYNESYDPKYGRLNNPMGWSPAARDYPPYAGNEYFEVTFGGQYRFTGIKMQIGPQGNESYVSTYRLSYSKENLVWYEYMENNQQRIFENDFWANGTEYNQTTEDPWVTNRLLEPFNAIAVRIIPIRYNKTDENSTAIPVVRFELIGCQRDPVIKSPSEFCQAEKEYPDYGYYERGFLVEPTNGYVYVCILEYVDGPTRCSLSRDNGTSWEAMDTNVANVLAVHHDDVDLEIFGLSQNRKAIMRSDDLGLTWYSVYPTRYLNLLKYESDKMKAAVPVPFLSLPKDPPKSYILNNDMVLKGNRSFTEWGAGMDGLYRRDMSLEVVEMEFWPEATTEPMTTADQTQTAGTTKKTTTQFMTTEEMTTRQELDLTTEEPKDVKSPWGPRNVTTEYPGAWESLGIWSGPE